MRAFVETWQNVGHLSKVIFSINVFSLILEPMAWWSTDDLRSGFTSSHIALLTVWCKTAVSGPACRLCQFRAWLPTAWLVSSGLNSREVLGFENWEALKQHSCSLHCLWQFLNHGNETFTLRRPQSPISIARHPTKIWPRTSIKNRWINSR